MIRKKRYTAGLAALDIFLTFFSGGLWLIVVLFREMYQHSW